MQTFADFVQAIARPERFALGECGCGYLHYSSGRHANIRTEYANIRTPAPICGDWASNASNWSCGLTVKGADCGTAALGSNPGGILWDGLYARQTIAFHRLAKWTLAVRAISELRKFALQRSAEQMAGLRTAALLRFVEQMA